MNNEGRAFLGVALFALGAILRSTDILDIVHEYMHIAFAATEGQKAISFSQSKTVFHTLNPVIIYSGYYGEAMLYGGLTFLLLFFSFKTAAMLPFGIYHVVVWAAYGSNDFRVHALSYFDDQGIVDANLQRWLILSAIALVILWIMTIKTRGHSSMK